jgi:ornithine carbamoyltransferase
MKSRLLKTCLSFKMVRLAKKFNLEDTLSVLSHYVDSIETDVDKEQIKTYMRTLYTEAVNIEVV